MGRFKDRNKPCSCGSGRKYKRCCEGKTITAPELRARLYDNDRKQEERQERMRVAGVLAAIAALGPK